MEVAVHWREMGGELATGLGMGLAPSLAGMNNAWSKCVACGSIVTGLIKHGGEIIEGSNGGRVPGLDCFLRELIELEALDRLGSVGCAFCRLLEDEDVLDVSYFIVIVDVELLNESAGVVGRVTGVRAATGGGGGREYLGGVEACSLYARRGSIWIWCACW